MELLLENISKRFGYQYILKDINAHFEGPGFFGISGPNGSGKSSLLSIISGYLSPSQGHLLLKINNELISRGEYYRNLTFCAPYIDITSEFNLREMVDFHQKFKPFKGRMDVDEFMGSLEVSYDPEKLIMNYSSGMIQRVKLGLSLLSDTPLLLLDEPTSFLDSKAIDWFWRFFAKTTQGKLIIMASNDVEDLKHCQKVYQIADKQLR